MKIINKIIQITSRIRSNPISKDNLIKAFSNYLYFNLSCRIKEEIIYKGINNIKFSIKKGDAGLVGNIYFGLYEFEDSMFVIHFLRENDFFLDIGSNLGHFSLIASGVANANSIAIEPIPTTYERLLKQIKINKFEDKIEALNIGLADVTSTLYFSTDRGTMNRIVDINYSNAIKVAVTTLDAINKTNKNISLIKMDVEGYENYVLQGGIETLSNINLKAIIVELNNSGAKYNISDNEVYSKLLKLNFEPYRYNPLKRELIKLDSYNKEDFNTIFIRDLDYVQERIANSEYYKIWNKKI